MKPTRFEWGCGLLALIAVWIVGFLAMQIPLLLAKDEAAYALLAGLAVWVIVGIVGFWRYVLLLPRCPLCLRLELRAIRLSDRLVRVLIRTIGMLESC